MPRWRQQEASRSDQAPRAAPSIPPGKARAAGAFGPLQLADGNWRDRAKDFSCIRYSELSSTERRYQLVDSDASFTD